MPYDDPDDAGKDSEQKILSESKKRFKLCEEAEKDLRALALEDLNFRAGDQWPEYLKQKRIQERKPCLTINVLPSRERQILNEQRQNRSAIQVSPVDGDADEDTADILQGIIRHIEYDSDADAAYDTASASATRIGFGFMRVLTVFESHDSFQQAIKIERVPNAFQCYLDPGATKADRSDANFGFIFETLTKDEFCDAYPDSELGESPDSWSSIGARDPGWMDEGGIRVVEYFYKENRKDTLLRIANPAGENREILQSDFDKLPANIQQAAKIVDQRETEVPVIHWCKHTCHEVLEETIWPGQWIPIIEVLGDEINVDGKCILEGLVRHAKDPMRMQNVMASEEVQAIALAPKAPFVAASGQIENHPEWQRANLDNYSVLTYEPVSVAGTLVPPPQRNVAEPPIQAISTARLQFSDDLKAVTGIYDAQLGARSNEKSGTAILQRKTQGELSNFHYIDNLNRALRHLGRQLVDLIPKIYSTPQMIRIIGEDGAQKVVKVNQEFQLGDGSTKKYDLTIGKYDVTISTGPSYQTRRQESVQSMLEMVRGFPQLAQIAGDLIVSAMDWPGHEKFAERLKKLLPPGVADDGADSDPKTQLAATQQKMQTLMQQHEMLTKALQHEIQLRETKQTELAAKADIEKYKADRQLDLERMKIEAQITQAEITSKSQVLNERVKFIEDVWNQLHGQAHELALQKDQQAHESDMADKNAIIAQAQAEQAQAQQPTNGTGQ